MEIRPEQPGDEREIADVIEAAFLLAKHRDGTEAQIVERLRGAGELTLSLVAIDNKTSIIGHAAFSPVTIDSADLGWFGLGPVAVLPDRQDNGIGSALIRDGLNRLQMGGMAGCVVVGEPDYYRRFGFTIGDSLLYPGVPPEYFQAIAFGGKIPTGIVAYRPAFG